ncbi:hypothetical protein ACLOJK_009387 [Asimina triloba]
MRPKIILFGDSITESSFDQGGWGSALASHFSRTADVVLRGYSGYNSRWAVEVMERVFRVGEKEAAAAPLAVTVFFGANDACLADRSSAFQHVPLHEYKHNLHAIVSDIKVFYSRASYERNTPYWRIPDPKRLRAVHLPHVADCGRLDLKWIIAFDRGDRAIRGLIRSDGGDLRIRSMG